MIAAVLMLAAIAFGTPDDQTLWYQQPANDPLNETLPVGNGRLGGLIFGVPQRERICLDESSLWTGDENPSGDYNSMGAYQALGDCFVRLSGMGDFFSPYRRELNLGDATAHVCYNCDRVDYQREFFCSHVANVLVARFTASKAGQYNGMVELQDGHGTKSSAVGNRLRFSGKLENGLRYECQAIVLFDGGHFNATNGMLEFSHCDGFTILIAAGTDYRMDYAAHFRGPDPHARVMAEVEAAAKKGFDALKAEHVSDYRGLFGRVTLDLGVSAEAQKKLPTDRRRIEAAKVADPELEQLLFQYGRYLLISCSRPGGLPANLQGLWNDRNNPAWHSDYHANINAQMNYWPAEVANLPECQLPFLDLISSQLPAWRQATAASPELNTTSGSPASRGFGIRTSHNIFGGMGWKWDKTANAWYCLHFWEHYDFSRDDAWLRATAYPVLKATCEFWEDHLKTLPDGRLVVPRGWSPEHGPEEDGVSYNQEIVWDLFDHYVWACRALSVDAEYRDKIAAMRDRLVTPGVGSWGQLLEWITEKTGTNAVPKHPELDTPRDHHRHTSHLFAVYPGHQIDMTRTPALARAARISLEARGTDPSGDVREWSLAWRAALYARLQDGAAAHGMLQQFFSTRNSCPNLFGLHPPMQIDGNFGMTAAIAEMLLQSRGDELLLLPALPAAWRAGLVKGLRARGGFTVDITWSNGRFVEAAIHSLHENRCTVRVGKDSVTFDAPEGVYRVDAALKVFPLPKVINN